MWGCVCVCVCVFNTTHLVQSYHLENSYHQLLVLLVKYYRYCILLGSLPDLICLLRGLAFVASWLSCLFSAISVYMYVWNNFFLVFLVAKISNGCVHFCLFWVPHHPSTCTLCLVLVFCDVLHLLWGDASLMMVVCTFFEDFSKRFRM